MAAKKIVIIDYEGGVTFFVDSQAAMQGLCSGRIRSQVVFDTVQAVMDLDRPVCFVWVKSHSGIADNEAVDELAKQATNLADIWDTPIPKQEVRELSWMRLGLNGMRSGINMMKLGCQKFDMGPRISIGLKLPVRSRV